MNKKNNKINRIKLRILLIALIGSLSLGSIIAVIVSLFNKKEKNDIKTTITQETDNTYFDDLIEEELEKKLIDLEEYIKVSNELNKILGKEYTIEDENLKNSVLKSPEEIKELISSYDKTKKDIDILRELKIQACLINKYLKTDGYNVLADALIYALKIEFVDAYGFDKEISEAILKQITIPSYTDMNFGNPEGRKNSIKIGNNYVTFNHNLENVLADIYNLQDNAGKKNTTGYNYNEDRNETLEEAFETLEELIKKDSTFKKLKIK